MKRLLCIVISLLFVTFSLTGCNILGGDLKALPYSFFASSEKIATDTMKKVVKAFDNRDKEMVKSLFATEVLKKYKNFDKDLEKAFKYYTIKSEKVDYDWAGDSDSTDENGTVAYTDCLATLKDKNDTFTFGVNVCYQDDTNELNEGVWCIYLQNEKLEPTKDSEINDSEPNYGIYLNR